MFDNDLVEDLVGLTVIAIVPGISIGSLGNVSLGILYGLGALVGYAFGKEQGKRLYNKSK